MQTSSKIESMPDVTQSLLGLDISMHEVLHELACDHSGVQEPKPPVSGCGIVPSVQGHRSGMTCRIIHCLRVSSHQEEYRYVALTGMYRSICFAMLHCCIVVLDSASMTVVYPFHAFMHKPCKTANILTLHRISQT
jgi:hypothetical protein